MSSSEDLRRSTATNALMYLLKDHMKKNGKVLQTYSYSITETPGKQTNNKSDI